MYQLWKQLYRAKNQRGAKAEREREREREIIYEKGSIVLPPKKKKMKGLEQDVQGNL